MRFRLEMIETPLCELLLVADERGAVRALEFGTDEARLRRLLQKHYGEFELVGGGAPAAVKRAIGNYFDGKLNALDAIHVETGGTPFQRKVWKGLRAIPVATTISYGELAANIGEHGASRAVGAANGANPVAIIVPCHRVIGADGTLTGYGGGIERKRWLLEHERKFSEAWAL